MNYKIERAEKVGDRQVEVYWSHYECSYCIHIFTQDSRNTFRSEFLQPGLTRSPLPSIEDLDAVCKEHKIIIPLDIRNALISDREAQPEKKGEDIDD